MIHKYQVRVGMQCDNNKNCNSCRLT